MDNNRVYALTDINQDGKTDFTDFFIVLKSIMKRQESVKGLDGNDKKRNTLNTIRSMIGVSAYQRYEPMIECAIEFIHKTHFLKKCFKCF